MKKQLVIQHDLSKLDAAQLAQYLRDVSEFIGLDPDLNGLDTLWMDNEQGPGKSLVVYARRGTAEILRNKMGIQVSSLTNQMVKDSIVFTAIGKNGVDAHARQEVATGSKYIGGLVGKQLDDAIMTASTRALRRLTMQFTSLGILDESEVKASVADTVNPATGASLAGSPVVLPPMPNQGNINNAPGRDVTPLPVPQMAVIPNFASHQTEMIEEAMKQQQAKVDTNSVSTDAPTSVSTVVAPVTSVPESAVEAAKPKRGRRARNTVSMETGPEPEVVSSPAPVPEVAPAAPHASPAASVAPVVTLTQVVEAAKQFGEVQPALAPAAPIQTPNPDFPGKPNADQMGEYRKRVSVYTSELPSSENMGSVQKMRAFITKMSGTAPQFMTTDQWEEMLGWFSSFVERNKVRGLVTYINDSLGVK